MNDTKNRPGSCDWLPEDNREVATGSSCDWQGSPSAGAGDNRSAVYPFQNDYTWQGVEQERYKAEDCGWSDIARNVLVGGRGESAGFDLRYFEIAPGGHSSLEKHVHEHVVIVIRGRGNALIAGEVHEVGFLDTLYISPDDPHQLINPFADPFGFFCIVSHDRDRPRPLDRDELGRLVATAVGSKLRP